MTTAVVVPIDEWNRITEKYADVEQIPEWQKKIIDQRLLAISQNPSSLRPIEELFAASVATATTLPLPTSLAGTTVRITDSKNVERLAGLFFTSPGQINYLLPAGLAEGIARSHAMPARSLPLRAASNSALRAE